MCVCPIKETEREKYAIKTQYLYTDTNYDANLFEHNVLAAIKGFMCNRCAKSINKWFAFCTPF